MSKNIIIYNLPDPHNIFFFKKACKLLCTLYVYVINRILSAGKFWMTGPIIVMLIILLIIQDNGKLL